MTIRGELEAYADYLGQDFRAVAADAGVDLSVSLSRASRSAPLARPITRAEGQAIQEVLARHHAAQCAPAPVKRIAS